MADQSPITKDQLANFWLENYCPDNHCCLCGNTGIIDTRGVKTPAGYLVGRRSWCLCPNGRAFKEQLKTEPEQ